MFAQSPRYPLNRYGGDVSFIGDSHAAAGLICLFGLLVRIVLSDPVLEVLGTGYASSGGSALSKVHPGVFFTYLSFILLLVDRARPLAQLARIMREQKTFSILLFVSLIIAVYWAFRGPQGLPLIIDTHLPVPITAIVLSYTPRSYCKRAVQVFIAFALLNSLIGIAEALGKFRVLTFAPDWAILSEDKFRASALLGHPLNNAAMTSFALFAALTLKGNPYHKALASGIFLTSLVGFGGRTAFIFSTFSLIIYGIAALKNALQTKRSLLDMILIISAAMVLPLVFIGGLYLAFSSGMGERLISVSSLSDPSAEARTVALTAFDYVNGNDLLFGMSSDRVDDIVGRMGLTLPMADIENPWILMILHLGLIFFTLWLLATALLIRKLVSGRPFMLKLTVLSYYLTASTFNSFGRKDFLYTMMVAVVLCVSRGFEEDRGSDYVQRTA